MKSTRITLQEAVRFHGHLGPYLVLGLLAGAFALKKLKSKKYFGLAVKVWGASQRPKSCLVDGLQLSTGATYGKGNIQKAKANRIRILVQDLKAGKKIEIFLSTDVIRALNNLKGRVDSERFARKIFIARTEDLFFIKS